MLWIPTSRFFVPAWMDRSTSSSIHELRHHFAEQRGAHVAVDDVAQDLLGARQVVVEGRIHQVEVVDPDVGEDVDLAQHAVDVEEARAAADLAVAAEPAGEVAAALRFDRAVRSLQLGPVEHVALVHRRDHVEAIENARILVRGADDVVSLAEGDALHVAELAAFQEHLHQLGEHVLAFAAYDDVEGRVGSEDLPGVLGDLRTAEDDQRVRQRAFDRLRELLVLEEIPDVGREENQMRRVLGRRLDDARIVRGLIVVAELEARSGVEGELRQIRLEQRERHRELPERQAGEAIDGVDRNRFDAQVRFLGRRVRRSAPKGVHALLQVGHILQSDPVVSQSHSAS